MKSLSVIFLPAVLVLAACAMGPAAVEEANPRVTYNYDPGEVEEAELRAERYCRENYGRDAELVSRAEDAGGDFVATYECVS